MSIRRRWIGDHSDRQGRLIAALLLGAAALLPLALYLITMPPTITWWFGGADSGELVTAAESFGVAHPTGYPLFTLLGFLSTRVPLGEIGGRVNAMNAVLAALAAGGIALSVVAVADGIARSRIARSIAGAVSALAVATSSLYWSQAIIAEVYALQAFLIALILLAWAWPRTPPVLRGAAHGLSLTNHLTAVIFLIAALVALIHPGRPVNWRAVTWFTGGLMAALALYALLPFRAAQDPLANWGDPDTPSRFLAHVTGRQYRGLVDAGDLPGAVRNFLSLVRLVIEDLPLWMLPAAGAGFYGLLRSRRAYAIFTGLAVAGTLIFIATYQAADRAPYLLPVYVTIGVWCGAGLLVAVPAALRWSAGDTARRAGVYVAGGAVVLLTVIWAGRAYGRVNLAGDDSAVVFARATLDALPPNATYYSARDDVTFALWYAQRSLSLRPDVRVIDIRNPDLESLPAQGNDNASNAETGELDPNAVADLSATAGNAHIRARDGADTTLDLANARLFVPQDAVDPGAMVGLGVGGIPSSGGNQAVTGAVVTAAGEMHAPLVLLIAPNAADRATLVGATPALLDTASGVRRPCGGAGGWVACTIDHPGTYVLMATSEPPADDGLLREALAALPAAEAGGTNRTLIRVLVIAGAALAGGAIAVLIGGRSADMKNPSSTDRMG